MRRLPAAGVVVVALVVSACVGERPTLGERELAPTSNTADDDPDADDDPAIVAQAVGDELAVYADADDDDPLGTVVPPTAPPPAPDEPATPAPIVVLVVEDPDATQRDRLRVQLPDNSQAWVDRDDVALSQTTFRIEIGLDDRRVVVRDAGEVVLEATVALGPDRPAPGALFVTGLVVPGDPSVYGAYAYGLSGGPSPPDAAVAGTGLVGLHGAADPATLGGDATTGSVALPDADVVQMAEELRIPLGTPVTVR